MGMKLYIYGAIKNYKARRPARFHMPGHKANRKRFPLFKDAPLDITELPFADCLESPEGIIADARRDIADALGARESFFLTDGSSCGVFAMIYIVRKRGGKVVIARNSHKSVYNACAALGVEPYIVQNNEKDGVLLPPTAADIETALKKERDVTAVLITSPDYYGNVADLSAIEKVCRRYNRIFMVDGAHGAYLKFDADARGLYAGECAHIWVDGSHKTMPTLTQGALLNVNDESLLADAAEGLNMFRTTSPSYPVMAGIEYGVKYMEENGAALIDAVRRELTLVKAKLRKAGIPFYAESKTLVLAVDFGAMGISPYRAEEELARRGVYAEMCDGRYLLFYFSALTSPVRLRMLEFRLRRIARMRSLKNTYEPPAGFACGVKKFSYLTANSLALEYVPLDKAAGRIAARNAGITPPCFPTVVAGEQITEAAAEALSKAAHTFGVYRGRVAVINIGGK